MPNGIFTLKQQVLAVREGGWPGQKPLAVDYLVVAGGGGGGGNGGAGGGGGGLLQGNIGITPGSSITVTVGAGGTGGSNPGSNGGNSVFGGIAATAGGGGGYGANPATSGVAGGSGGGSAAYDNIFRAGAQGVSGQGNAGGPGLSLGTNTFSSGGGGGAGTIGTGASSTTVGGNGGTGIASDISGTRTAYAGGGAGGGNSFPTNYGVGGAGGGGGSSTTTTGTANTGGGGAGGGNGGSGIVILSYPDIYAAAASTTGSPTVSTSGSGSINLTSSQRIVYANNAAFQFGTGNFTVEAFVYLPTLGSYNIIAKCADDSSWSNGWTLVISSGPQFWVNGSLALAGTTLSTSTWHHIAVVRNGTALVLYVNGVSASTATSSANIAPTQPLSVGGEQGSGSFLLGGYVSNLRVVKGSAVYTAAFPSPTVPLTSVSGTSLLLGAVSGAFLADSSGNNFVPTSVVNSPTWNSLSPFATGLGYKNRVYTWTSSGSITF
jgi:hypothetical protein